MTTAHIASLYPTYRYHTLGNCDVSGRFAKGTYVLDVTPLQAIILMQFA